MIKLGQLWFQTVKNVSFCVDLHAKKKRRKKLKVKTKRFLVRELLSFLIEKSVKLPKLIASFAY